MIRVLIIVVFLVAGLILAPELSNNKGYLLISFDSYTTYETTIINAAFVALLFYAFLLVVEWILRKVLSMSSFTRGWFGQRKTRKAQKHTLLGLLSLYEGNTIQAQKLLSKSAGKSDAPGINFIAAAKASHLNADFILRDEYLQIAGDYPGCRLAAGLVHVELQRDAFQFQSALLNLKELDKLFPKNKQISLHYMAIYPALNEWEKLIALINKKRKLLGLSDSDFSALELEAYQHLFRKLASESGQLLNDFWHKNMARWMRKELVYQEAVLSAFIEYDHGKLAQEFLLDKLQRQLSLPLLPYLQKINVIDHYPIIVFLEKQMKKSEHSNYIHQALAYLKLKESQPKASIKHLVESVETLPSIEDFQLLASLLSKQGRDDEANLYYRKGLEFAAR